MTQNTDYTDADLLALLAAIEAECKKLEDPFCRDAGPAPDEQAACRGSHAGAG